MLFFFLRERQIRLKITLGQLKNNQHLSMFYDIFQKFRIEQDKDSYPCGAFILEEKAKNKQTNQTKQYPQ